MHVACEPVELRDDQLGLVLLAGSKRRGELWPVGSLATLDLDMLGDVLPATTVEKIGDALALSLQTQ